MKAEPLIIIVSAPSGSGKTTLINSLQEKMPGIKSDLARRIYYLCHYLHIDNWHKVSKQWIKDYCLTPYSNHLYSIGKVVGAHAYAISLSAAKKFVAYQQPVIVQSDRIFNYYKAAFGLEGFAVRTKLFTLSGASNISYISDESPPS